MSEARTTLTREERIQEARDKIDLSRLKSVKPHLTKFFKVSKIADEPGLTPNAFWPKPKFHKAFDYEAARVKTTNPKR